MSRQKAPKFYSLLLCVGMLGVLGDIPPVSGLAPPILTSPSFLIMDPDTGNVIYGRHIHAVRAPASTTKIMTVLLALEMGNLDDIVTVSRRAARQEGCKLGLSEGEQIPLGDLAKATIIKSGNDGAVAIAEHLGGSVENFARLMNLRAQALGMENTHFVNPNGMPNDQHCSTAYDLSLLATEAMKHPEFRQWVSMREVHFDVFGNRTNVTFENTNHLLDIYPFANGVKTGYTDLAGYCIVASATFRDKTLIAVVLGCERNRQWPEAIQLFDFAFSLYDPDYMEFRNLIEHGGVF